MKGEILGFTISERTQAYLKRIMVVLPYIGALYFQPAQIFKKNIESMERTESK